MRKKMRKKMQKKSHIELFLTNNIFNTFATIYAVSTYIPGSLTSPQYSKSSERSAACGLRRANMLVPTIRIRSGNSTSRQSKSNWRLPSGSTCITNANTSARGGSGRMSLPCCIGTRSKSTELVILLITTL